MKLYIDSPTVNVTLDCASLADARRLVQAQFIAGLRDFAAELVDSVGDVVACYEFGRGWTGA